ncbi:Tenascin-R [Holothuria leucospilota]|uniref:Tenascin-R n=1 Tax=Holothuria leucospilota TaxID=206669 RepID=A0A9Q1BW06_HOLLE|nr:Tenascin-R [Holothuria leucospilota]
MLAGMMKILHSVSGMTLRQLSVEKDNQFAGNSDIGGQDVPIGSVVVKKDHHFFFNLQKCWWKEESECDNPEECNPLEVSTDYTDCNDVYNAGETQDDVYYISPEGWDGPPFKVFCNMSIDGGSWTVFQRRVNGSTNFYRKWIEYRDGFGDIQHEFWLGNEKLHYITEQATYKYRMDFVYSSSSFHNKYPNFHVDDETNKYRLAKAGSWSGTRGICKLLVDYGVSSVLDSKPIITYDRLSFSH